ncbi:MAG: UDP-N-acetylmuramate--L-alanine ligase [Lachnospiraceae bacterium]|nr:UDP-N-acetylmuramate--L-alanine ligase [Lachnospiraceae bacterium]
MKNIHMIGIGGISMSGIAELLLSEGYTVSGSDAHESEMTDKLEELGAKIGYPQKADNIPEDTDTVVMTAAIHSDNPELLEAQRRGLKVWTRAEFLGEIMKKYNTPIAIAGTHGKTTTTGMVSEILVKAGMDPTISIGGMLKDIGGNFRVGSSDYFVMEACEYTNSYHAFYPKVGVILNVEADHLDFFKDIDDIRRSFHRFGENVFEDGTLVIGKEIEKYQVITEGLKCKVVTFGRDESADIYPTDVVYDELAQPAFTANMDGKSERYRLGVHGEHNVMNALAAIAACKSIGISYEDIKKGLEEYKGTDRRFELKGKLKVMAGKSGSGADGTEAGADDKGTGMVGSGTDGTEAGTAGRGSGITIIDDYAHHPTEIKATLKTAAAYPHNNMWVVFQPHTYTRTKALMDEFAEALSMAEHVIITDIYPARETDNLGISGKTLADRISEKGTECYYIGGFDEVKKFIKKTLVDNDLLITMGAGDVVKIGDELLSEM